MKDEKKGCVCTWLLPLFAPFSKKVIHSYFHCYSFIWYESIFHLLTFIWNLPVTKYDSSWLSGELKWYIFGSINETINRAAIHKPEHLNKNVGWFTESPFNR